MKKFSAALFALSASLFFSSDAPVNAAPKCKDSYQFIKGHGWIATPYCGDKWLAQISGYSFAKIRNDPSVKERVCQLYGRNIKVRSICGSLADGIFIDRIR